MQRIEDKANNSNKKKKPKQQFLFKNRKNIKNEIKKI
jgi:hypothetical protein